ncbi:hypothetical protein G9A89_020135 [Geosiphon pyriformis]|nr:hypothetical protein G9A89_020135 [Geosiphon pyriformis]
MLSDSAKWASLGYCLKTKNGDEIIQGVFVKVVVTGKSKREQDLVVYFKGLPSAASWPTFTKEGSPKIFDQWTSRNFELEGRKILEKVVNVDKNFYKAFQLASQRIQEIILEQLALKKEVRKIRYIGHGMGGVYALLSGITFHASFGPYPVEIVTFGQPPVGAKNFAKLVNDLRKYKVEAYRVTYSNDYVPKLPMSTREPMLFHHAYEIWITEDCSCPGSQDVFVCSGPIVDGFITEHPDCNKGSKSISKKANRGPYFGHLMGRCPLDQSDTQ